MLLRTIGAGRIVQLLCLLGLLLFSGARAGAYIYYVSPGGNDANDGKTWATAKATVQGAMDLATSSDQIWVAAGTYIPSSTITINSGVELYGGFNGTETALDQRDYVHNVTILDGNNYLSAIVEAPINTSIFTRVDGFTLQHTTEPILANGALIVANNTFADSTGVFLYTGPATVIGNTFNGVQLQVYANSGMYISGNNVSGCTGDGINITNYSSVTITGNTITNNSGAGIRLSDSAQSHGPYGITTLVSNNTVEGNTASGIYYDALPNQTYASGNVITIKDNLVAGNSTAGLGGGILIDLEVQGTVNLTNNTLVDNAAGDRTFGGGIFVIDLGTVNIANNIVAFNSSGIDGSATGTILTTNDVYGSVYNNYDGPQPGATDISLDPLFVDHINRDYHLTTPSPCIDAGYR